MRQSIACLAVAVAALVGCSLMAELPPEATLGPDPKLPPPSKSLIPTVHIARKGLA